MAIYEAAAGNHFANESCYVCGRTKDIVNTETQIVGEGVLGLCAVCVRDFARVLGLDFNDAYVAELRQRAERAERERDEAIEVRSALQEAIDKAATPRPRSKK